MFTFSLSPMRFCSALLIHNRVKTMLEVRDLGPNLGAFTVRNPLFVPKYSLFSAVPDTVFSEKDSIFNYLPRFMIMNCFCLCAYLIKHTSVESHKSQLASTIPAKMKLL